MASLNIYMKRCGSYGEMKAGKINTGIKVMTGNIQHNSEVCMLENSKVDLKQNDSTRKRIAAIQLNPIPEPP